jgi:effector-binding domain-containing protein
MNRSQLCRNFLLAVVLMFGATVISASAQEARMQGPELSAREMQSVRAAAMRPAPTALYAVTQDFEGNFENVDALMARFAEEAKRQGLPNANPVGVVFLYEDPTGKSQFRMGVGITLARKAEVKEPLKVTEMRVTAVRATHVGSYQQLGRVYNVIENTVKESRPQAKGVAAMPRETSWPVILRLISDPKKARAAGEIRTEIIVPIKQ